MSRSLCFIAIMLVCASSINALDDRAHIPPHNCHLHPQHAARISQDSSHRGPITADAYEKLIQRFTAHFTPIVQAQGARLEVIGHWDNDQIRARAFRIEDQWSIEITGGLARHPDLTLDGLALVMCHELGHHLGGFPRYSYPSTGTWSSTEGQADYYATTKCTRSLWQDDDNRLYAEKILVADQLPYSVISSCYDKHEEENDISLCIRANWAAVSVSRYFADVFADRPPQFETPNRTRTHRTIESHPNVQCRLDTFHQGSLCPISHQISLGDKAETGACTRKKQQAVGSRPLCWFRPTRLY